jgi:hypothetical protein
VNENQLQSAQHSSIRIILCVGGPAIAGAGLVFMIIGIGSFFTAFTAAASSEFPRYFWCAFVGIPLLFIGSGMCMFGFMGTVQRYVAGESAPVAKDVVNYMGENIQPGVKAVTKAVTEGVIEAQKERQ